MSSLGFSMLVKTKKQEDTVRHRQETHQLKKLRIARQGLHNTPCLGDPYWSSLESDGLLHMMTISIASAAHAPLYQPSQAMEGQALKDLYAGWCESMKELDKDTAIYYPILDQCEYGWSNNRPTLKVPLASNILKENQHQDFSKITHPVIKFHGTRNTILPNILRMGIASSEESHGKTGLWTNSQLDWTLDWNSTVLEPFPGTSLQLVCEKSHICNNRRVRVANPQSTRSVIVLNSHTPSVRLTHIYMLIPSKDQLDFRNDLLKAIKNAIVDLLSSQHVANLEAIVSQTITLVEYRASYSGCKEAFELEFGGPFDAVAPIAAHLSMQVARFVQGLSVDNVNTRLRHFQYIFPKVLPSGFIKWMNSRFPDVSLLFSRESPTTNPDWRTEPLIVVQKWGYLTTSLPDGPQELESLQ